MSSSATPSAAPSATELRAALRDLVTDPASAVDLDALAPPPNGGRDRPLQAAIVLGSPEAPGVDLGGLRARMAPRGRLYWAGPPGEARLLRLALAEAGFVVERRRAGPGGTELLVARRDEITVRAYRMGDEAAILALFRIAFDAPRSPERWAWAYRDHPGGAYRISEAFDAQGRLVAHYAGYPARLWRSGPAGGERLAAQHVGDTMTAKEVRHLGRGPTSVLGRTVDHFYARFCEGRLAFNYGFNTATAQGLSVRFFGARKVEPVALRTRAAAPWPAAGWRERLAGGYTVERVSEADPGFDALFARVSGAYGLLFERGAEHVAWRYLRFPGGGYAVYRARHRGRHVGYAVFRAVGERLVWGDALFDPAHRAAAARVLERAAADHPETRVVEGWFPPRPAWWDETLVRLGFERRPEPNDLALVMVPFERDLEAELRERLYYTKGDGDLF